MRKSLLLTAAALVFGVPTAMAAGKGQPTVPICHHGIDEITGLPTIEIITVSNQAVASHIANHGDNVVSDEICGDGVDNDCNGVADDGCCPCWEVGELSSVTAENQQTEGGSCIGIEDPPFLFAVIQNNPGSTPDVEGGFLVQSIGEQSFCGTRDFPPNQLSITPEQAQVCALQIAARCEAIGTPIPPLP